MPLSVRYFCFFLLLLYVPVFAQNPINGDLEALLKEGDTQEQIETIKQYIRQLSFDEKVKYLELAITLARDRQLTRQEAALYVQKGVAHYGEGDYPQTLDNYQKALDLYEALEDFAGMGACYNELAIFVKKQKDYSKAKTYLSRSLAFCRQAGDSLGVSTSYDNLGLLYTELGEWKKAEQNYLRTLAIRLEVKDSVGLTYVYNNLAEVAVQKKRFSEAIELMGKSTELRRELRDSTGLAINMTNLGELYFKQGQFSKAAKHFEQSLDYSQRIKYLDLSKWNYEYASKSYAALGNTEKALQYLSRSYALKDSLLSEKRIRDLAEMETKYETEKKEQQILLQQLELDNQRQHYQSRLAAALAAIIGLLMLAIFGFLFYRNQQKTRQLAFQEELLHTTMEVQEQERKRISKDLHDGIGQQLTGLKMAWQNLSGQIVQQAPAQIPQLQRLDKILEAASTDVRTISHQMMPRALRELGLIPALEDLVDSSFQNSPITCEFNQHGLDQRLDEKIEINLYRVIQELINNIQKHAQATEVGIQIYKNKEQVIAVVEDNGCGFDQQVTNKKNHGLLNITSRIRSIRGEVAIQSKVGEGTITTMKVPI